MIPPTPSCLRKSRKSSPGRSPERRTSLRC
nr:MAG TPA: hypothetical protein [Caudoviricetes sp.]